MNPRGLALVLFGAAACTTPSYTFAPDDAGLPPPIVVPPKDAGPGDVDAPVDAGADRTVPTGPITAFPIDIPSTGDFAADCAAMDPRLASGDVRFVVGPGTGTPRCTFYLPTQPWGRTYADAKVACTQITHRGRQGALVSIRGREKGLAILAAQFQSNMTPWIGLEALPAADASVKANWQWVSGETVGYDGWESPPTGVDRCANWTNANGEPQWKERPCDQAKGFLCEVEEGTL